MKKPDFLNLLEKSGSVPAKVTNPNLLNKFLAKVEELKYLEF